MKKSIVVLFLMLLFLSTVDVTAYVYKDYIRVIAEGDEVYFDQRPLIFDGRTLIPIRAVCEKIGATVGWDKTTQTMTISKGVTTLSLKMGSNVMKVSDGTTVPLDVSPKNYSGRILLPVRVIVEKLGYEVTWSVTEKIVEIEEMGTFKVEGIRNTQLSNVQNWAWISSIQQFPYKNEGLAYAYVDKDRLNITTPQSQFSLEMKYPKLGDVISDDDGNFYIVWGRDNETDDASIETVFISKYTPLGQHIKTRGFVGKSSPWNDSDSAKTKIPFDASNCISVIGNGILVNYHGKERYDGHQSDNVVAVSISDMSPYELPNDTYTGHSFNQGLIYSSWTSDFLFASQGDAYIRGFRINNSSGKYGYEKENIFHFYLEQNANYNMYLVNKTYAQLGNLSETSSGVAFVGASAKSISEEAKTEKQNLFVQIFNPNVNGITSSMFIGGTTRSGEMSFNINDNMNTPLTSVTDYGVHWLTDYTDTDVLAPQVIAANDQLIILWATKSDTYYMILSASGDVIKPATSLGGVPLNSYERPVYFNKAIYWVAAQNGRLKVRSIEL